MASAPTTPSLANPRKRKRIVPTNPTPLVDPIKLVVDVLTKNFHALKGSRSLIMAELEARYGSSVVEIDPDSVLDAVASKSLPEEKDTVRSQADYARDCIAAFNCRVMRKNENENAHRINTLTISSSIAKSDLNLQFLAANLANHAVVVRVPGSHEKRDLAMVGKMYSKPNTKIGTPVQKKWSSLLKFVVSEVMKSHLKYYTTSASSKATYLAFPKPFMRALKQILCWASAITPQLFPEVSSSMDSCIITALTTLTANARRGTDESVVRDDFVKSAIEQNQLVDDSLFQEEELPVTFAAASERTIDDVDFYMAQQRPSLQPIDKENVPVDNLLLPPPPSNVYSLLDLPKMRLEQTSSSSFPNPHSQY